MSDTEAKDIVPVEGPDIILSRGLAMLREETQGALTDAKSEKEALLPELRKRGIVSITIEYDGSGDSGSVESVEAFNEKGDSVPLTDKVKTFVKHSTFDKKTETWGSVDVELELTLDDAIEQIASGMINGYFPGWENNDGAYGTVTFNVGEGSLELDHNARYTEVNSYTESL